MTSTSPRPSSTTVLTDSTTAASTMTTASLIQEMDDFLQRQKALDQIHMEDTLDLSSWSGHDWQTVLGGESHQFALALQAAEQELDQTIMKQHQPTAAPNSSNQTITPTPVAPHHTEIHAFEQWAQRIARMHILDVSDSTRDDPTAPPIHLTDLPVDPVTRASLAPSAEAPNSPEAQLLRMRILLAQEEAKNVQLEDDLFRLQNELDQTRAENLSLQQANASLTAKNLQQLAHSNGCTNGCGLIRIENETLKEQCATLRLNLEVCQQQMEQLLVEVKSQRIRSPSTTSNETLTYPTSASISSTSTTSTAATSDLTSSSNSLLNQLRVRCALSLARLTLRHQSELDHLMHYKLHHLTLQNTIDDLENALDVERELLQGEKFEHERTRAEVRKLQQDEAQLQALLAQMVSQLQKSGGNQGLSISMLSPTQIIKPSSTDPSSSNSLQPPTASYQTPLRKQSNGINGTGSSPISPNGGGGSGWGIGGWLGFGSANKASGENKK